MTFSKTDINALKWNATEMLITGLKVHLGSKYVDVYSIIVESGMPVGLKGVEVKVDVSVISTRSILQASIEVVFEKSNDLWRLQGDEATVINREGIHRARWFIIRPSREMRGLVLTKPTLSTDKLNSAIGTSQYHRQILKSGQNPIAVMSAIEAGVQVDFV